MKKNRYVRLFQIGGLLSGLTGLAAFDALDCLPTAIATPTHATAYVTVESDLVSPDTVYVDAYVRDRTVTRDNHTRTDNPLTRNDTATPYTSARVAPAPVQGVVGTRNRFVSCGVGSGGEP